MAKVKKEDIAEYATDELVEKVKDEKLRYRKMKFNHAITPLDNPKILTGLRRDIARLLTELNKRKNSEAQNKNVEA